MVPLSSSGESLLARIYRCRSWKDDRRRDHHEDQCAACRWNIDPHIDRELMTMLNTRFATYLSLLISSRHYDSCRYCGCALNEGRTERGFYARLSWIIRERSLSRSSTRHLASITGNQDNYGLTLGKKFMVVTTVKVTTIQILFVKWL